MHFALAILLVTLYSLVEAGTLWVQQRRRRIQPLAFVGLMLVLAVILLLKLPSKTG